MATESALKGATDPLVRDQLLAQQAKTEDRHDLIIRAGRQLIVFLVFVVLLGALYTGYKAFGASIDDAQHDWPAVGSFLPRSDHGRIRR